MSAPLTASQARLMGRIERALIHGGDTHNFREDVLPMLLDGRLQWWSHNDSVCITEIRQHPKRRELHCWLVAGDLDDCVAMQPQIEDWAIGQDVRQITAIGRPGWRPTVARMGFREVGIALRRNL